MSAGATRYAAAILATVIVGGCATSPRAPAPSSPQLLSAGQLDLPAGCEARGSVYVSYTVLENGTAANIAPENAPACVQQAVTAWIASFRYSPQTMAVPLALEWLVVTGDRS
jgi:hypothetical protein